MHVDFKSCIHCQNKDSSTGNERETSSLTEPKEIGPDPNFFRICGSAKCKVCDWSWMPATLLKMESCTGVFL